LVRVLELGLGLGLELVVENKIHWKRQVEPEHSALSEQLAQGRERVQQWVPQRVQQQVLKLELELAVSHSSMLAAVENSHSSAVG